MKDMSTLKGVIDFAMEKEAESQQLYKNLAGRIKSERLAGILIELAAEEQKHYDALKTLDLDLIPDAPREVPDLKISDSMHEVSYSPDMNFQDILVLSMKAEEHSHSLYNGLAKHAEDPELKKLFEFIASQEAEHKLRLETEYDEFILTQD